MSKPIPVSEIEAALRASGGFVSYAAIMLGISERTIYNKLEKHPELKLAKASIEESHLDLAESKLIEKVKAGELGAICFYLKCKGKGRGYIEKQQVEHSGNAQAIGMQKIEIEFIKSPQMLYS